MRHLFLAVLLTANILCSLACGCGAGCCGGWGDGEGINHQKAFWKDNKPAPKVDKEDGPVPKAETR